MRVHGGGAAPERGGAGGSARWRADGEGPTLVPHRCAPARSGAMADGMGRSAAAARTSTGTPPSLPPCPRVCDQPLTTQHHRRAGGGGGAGPPPPAPEKEPWPRGLFCDAWRCPPPKTAPQSGLTARCLAVVAGPYLLVPRGGCGGQHSVDGARDPDRQPGPPLPRGCALMVGCLRKWRRRSAARGMAAGRTGPPLVGHRGLQPRQVLDPSAPLHPPRAPCVEMCPIQRRFDSLEQTCR